MALIDLGRATQCAYGGIGFGIEHPATIVSLEKSDSHSITGLQKICPQRQIVVGNLLNKLKVLSGTSARASIEQVAPSHAGFGSCTTLLLSLIQAYCAASGLALTRKQKQSLSGRGGASGIGINLFFDGGVIRDSGRPWSEVEEIGPSRSSSPRTMPRISAQEAFPPDWSVSIILAPGHSMSGEEEAAFFSRHTPIPSIETESTRKLVDEVIFPCFRTSNLDGLKVGLEALKRVGFKAREVASQSDTVKELLAQLEQIPGIASGLSSFGPTVYAISKKTDQHSFKRMDAVVNELGAELITTKATPTGSGFKCYEQ